MKGRDTTIILGLALAGAGILFLLMNLGLLGPAEQMIWMAMFTIGGLAFLLSFGRDRARWWAVVPGCVLLSIGALIGLNEFAPWFDERLGGALILGGISLSFWLIYLSDRARWWAVVPGGVLLTLAVITGLPIDMSGERVGAVLFLGLALTFGLVYLLPAGQARNRWAIYPAAMLLLMALLIMVAMGQVIDLLWPIALILAGLYLAYRTLRVQPR